MKRLRQNTTQEWRYWRSAQNSKANHAPRSTCPTRPRRARRAVAHALYEDWLYRRDTTNAASAADWKEDFQALAKQADKLADAYDVAIDALHQASLTSIFDFESVGETDVLLVHAQAVALPAALAHGIKPHKNYQYARGHVRDNQDMCHWCGVPVDEDGSSNGIAIQELEILRGEWRSRARVWRTRARLAPKRPPSTRDRDRVRDRPQPRAPRGLARHRFRVYVIEAVHADEGQVFYVGVTAHDPATRLEQHKQGASYGGRTRRVGRGLRRAYCDSFKLRPDLAPRRAFTTRHEALRWEKRTAAALRRAGANTKGGI